jgi:hypothetical protein
MFIPKPWTKNKNKSLWARSATMQHNVDKLVNWPVACTIKNILIILWWLFWMMPALKRCPRLSCGLYHKHVTIVNDSPSIVSKWSFKLYDDPRVIIYDCHRFITQATDVINYDCKSDATMEPHIFVLYEHKPIEGSSEKIIRKKL